MASVAAKRRRGGVVGLLLIAALAFSTISAESASALGLRERRMVNKHNRARDARDIRMLSISDSLSRKAEQHSMEMAGDRDLYHSSCLTCQFDGYSWSIGGENVGVGGSVWRLFDAFMASAPHRENILNKRYKRIGVGVVESGGRLWVTVLFYG